MPNIIFWKCFLYGVPLFLTPFVDKIGPILFLRQWPSVPEVVGCTLLGTVSASIGLRAYFDGSYERSLSDKEVPAPVPPKV